MALKFKIPTVTKIAKEEKEKRNAEVEAAKEFSRKHPDRYFPVIDAVDIPLPRKGKIDSLLRLIVQRDGNEDIEDVENALCLDVRLFIRRPDDEDFIATKKGIHIPYEFAAHLANTINEMVEDCEALRKSGKNF